MAQNVIIPGVWQSLAGNSLLVETKKDEALFRLRPFYFCNFLPMDEDDNTC
jgi:hypothetical protein